MSEFRGNTAKQWEAIRVISENPLLNQINKRGAQLKLTRAAVSPDELARHLSKLRFEGHAVVADETFDHRGVSLGITVIHYLTCKRCNKGD